VQASQTVLQRTLEMPGTALERLGLLVSKVLENKGERVGFHQLSVQMLHDEALPEKLREHLRQSGQTYQNVFRQLIVEGQAAGEIATDDPDQLVTAVLGCLEGLSRLRRHGPEQPQQPFPDAAMILRMLKG
jgi:hypothetical protein